MGSQWYQSATMGKIVFGKLRLTTSASSGLMVFENDMVGLTRGYTDHFSRSPECSEQPLTAENEFLTLELSQVIQALQLDPQNFFLNFTTTKMNMN